MVGMSRPDPAPVRLAELVATLSLVAGPGDGPADGAGAAPDRGRDAARRDRRGRRRDPGRHLLHLAAHLGGLRRRHQRAGRPLRRRDGALRRLPRRRSRRRDAWRCSWPVTWAAAAPAAPDRDGGQVPRHRGALRAAGDGVALPVGQRPRRPPGSGTPTCRSRCSRPSSGGTARASPAAPARTRPGPGHPPGAGRRRHRGVPPHRRDRPRPWRSPSNAGARSSTPSWSTASRARPTRSSTGSATSRPGTR